MCSNMLRLAQVRSQSKPAITMQTALFFPDLKSSKVIHVVKKNTAFQQEVFLKLRLLRCVRNRIRIVNAIGITAAVHEEWFMWDAAKSLAYAWKSTCSWVLLLTRWRSKGVANKNLLQKKQQQHFTQTTWQYLQHRWNLTYSEYADWSVHKNIPVALVTSLSNQQL